VQVDKKMLEKMAQVATKGDIYALKEDFNKLETRVDKLDNRMVAGFIAILLGIVALLAIWYGASRVSGHRSL